MNYVVAAYAVIWVVFFLYVFMIGRKISGLENEIAKMKK